jgi:hypothetical protein
MVNNYRKHFVRIANRGQLSINRRTWTRDRMGYIRDDGMVAPIFGLIGAYNDAADMFSNSAKSDVIMNSLHYNWNSWAYLPVTY